jgi:hypothetical protein
VAVAVGELAGCGSALGMTALTVLATEEGATLSTVGRLVEPG